LKATKSIIMSFCVIMIPAIVYTYQYFRQGAAFKTSTVPETEFEEESVRQETTRMIHRAGGREKQRPALEPLRTQKDSVLFADPEHAVMDTSPRAKELRDRLTAQLNRRIQDPNTDHSEIYRIANDLIRTGDSKSLSAVLEAGRQAEEAGFPSIGLLRAIAGVNNSALTSVLERYAQIAITERHDALLGAISDALANIGTSESVGVLRDITLSSAPESDVALIVSESLSAVRSVQAILALADIITERAPGYEGAMKALLNMEGRGAYELAELIEDDNRGELEEVFYFIMDDIEYDEELYRAFEELARQPVRNPDVYLFAMQKLEEAKVRSEKR